MQLTDEEWEFIGRYVPIGEYGPYPERLRQQFEGVWRFKTDGQWREMPQDFGAWSTVHNRFRQWRDAGVFEALLEGLIAEAAKRGEVDLSLVTIDSTTARAHHDAAGMHLGQDALTALEKAAAEEEKARSKEAEERNGQEAEADPEREERRRTRRRRGLRLKAALLGRTFRPRHHQVPPGPGDKRRHTSVTKPRCCRPRSWSSTANQAPRPPSSPSPAAAACRPDGCTGCAGGVPRRRCNCCSQPAP